MPPQSTAALLSTSLRTATDSTDSGGPVHSKGLARKLTCVVVSVVFTGVLVILFIQVGLILSAVPGWENDTEDRMVELEVDNLEKIASDKAEYVTEIFGRVQEGILQLQAFAEQVLLDKPSKMVVENYLMTYPGLEQDENTYEYSVWFVPSLDEGEDPERNSSLEIVVDRSSFMDVPFRSMQLQNSLMYLAALDEPDINMQSYWGRYVGNYINFSANNGCDDRYDVETEPENYDPRCREWYQDAIADGNTGVIFSDPYTDAQSSQLIITVSAPVYNSTTTTLMGVVGIDVDLSDIQESIVSLTIIDDDSNNDENGYAYLLAPGGTGEVIVHRDLDLNEDEQFIIDLEEGVDEDEFNNIVSQISMKCDGSGTYLKNGKMWLLAWEHEAASVADVEDGGCDGYAIVVTVSESALLEEFSHLGDGVRRIVTIASVIMAVVLVIICLFTIAFAIAVSNGIVKPINQLIDVVHALYTMDFSKHQVGSWIVNEVSSPEVEELIEAFKAMSTVVKAANISLRSGNLVMAKENYVNALILFKKLEDERGVAITNNNLGTVHTLQAQECELNAVDIETHDSNKARILNDEATGLYSDAATNYGQAIDDAAMLCAAIVKNDDDSSSLLLNSRGGTQAAREEMKELETIDATYEDESGDAAALFLQLSNRKFNLAMCNASRGYSVVPGGAVRDPEAIDRARDLLQECIKLTDKSKDEKGHVCRVRYLLELANLESCMQRQIQAGENLDAVEKILALYRSDTNTGYAPGAEPKEGSPRFLLVVGLHQRLLAARGQHSMVSGDAGTAIACWTRAIIGSGDKMDVMAMESSLKGLSDLVSLSGPNGIQLPPDLRVALGLPANGVNDGERLVSAINDALVKVEQTRDRMMKNGRGVHSETTSVDLCFVMDCTGSMQSWIDQAKTKLVDIIEQAKADAGDLNLRVGFVGYRDFGDRPQYEGPYNFHTEQRLPELVKNLKHIKAFGGTDFPEDMAGGLNLAVNELSWKSHVRLCILIADAPCHGNMYHSGLGDRFPDGDKKGMDPTKLLYDLKYKHGVDLYFIKITDFTDKMIRVFQTRLANMQKENKSRVKTARSSTDLEIKVHDLGSDDNRFLEAVVESVKTSVQRSPLLVEE